MQLLLPLAVAIVHPSQEPEDRPVAKEFVAVYEGRVPASYMRTKSPHLILDFANAVRDGKARSSELENLVGSRLTRALTEVQAPKPGSSGAIPSPSALTALIAAPEAEPDKVSFPAIYDGAKAIAETRVRCVANGLFSASLPENPNFRVLQVAVRDSRVEDRAGGESRLRLPAAVRRIAPWTVPVQAGQEAIVTLVFEPKFNLSKNPAGMKSTILTLSGPRLSGPMPWTIKVPVEGRFSGVDLGLLAWPKPADIHYIKGPGYKPGKTYAFTANAGLLSMKSGASGRITAVSLPEAVSMAPQDFTVKKGEALDFPIRFKIGTSGVFFTNDKPYPIRLKVVDSGKTQFLDYVLRVFEGYHLWSVGPMEVGSVDKLYVELYLDSRGAYVASMRGTNNHLLKNRNVYAKMFFDGQKYPFQDLFRQVGRDTGFVTSIRRDPNDALRNNYLKLIKAKMTVRVEVTPAH